MTATVEMIPLIIQEAKTALLKPSTNTLTISWVVLILIMLVVLPWVKHLWC